jgi:hypothetical protein
MLDEKSFWLQKEFSSILQNDKAGCEPASHYNPELLCLHYSDSTNF